MDRETLIRQWLIDLRGGEFKQGRGALASGDRRCCLGVLCETYIRLGGELRKVKVLDGLQTSYDRHTGNLPDVVRAAAGLSVATAEDLVHLNDEKKWSFSQIADWVTLRRDQDTVPLNDTEFSPRSDENEQ